MLLGFVEDFLYRLLFTIIGVNNADPSSIQLSLTKGSDIWMQPINSNNLSLIDFSKETTFIIHGYKEDPNYILYPELVKALQPTGNNIITVDWGKLSKGPNYFTAVRNVQFVGETLAEFIIANSFDVSKVRIIGFSLGAHVAGITGKMVKKNKHLVIPRIIGLDPAGPLYGYLDKIPSYRRLDTDDATMVITLSSNEYFFGTRFRLGKVNFIANNGVIQTDCFNETRIMLCSHRRALVYYTQAINSDGFVGVSTEDTTLVLGDGISDSDEGTYTFKTNR